MKIAKDKLTPKWFSMLAYFNLGREIVLNACLEDRNLPRPIPDPNAFCNTVADLNVRPSDVAWRPSVCSPSSIAIDCCSSASCAVSLLQQRLDVKARGGGGFGVMMARMHFLTFVRFSLAQPATKTPLSLPSK